jgi:predicted glutamine amidotransferase
MCRFVAYIGQAIILQEVVVLPPHSLLQQSQHATEAKLAVNGDGFGIAWYKDTNGDAPGLYRDVLPAWSDGNLIDLCRMISSPLFLAHVRASTVGETSRSNCHPFRHRCWSFMHNGQIADFAKIRRRLEAELDDELFSARRGHTDSELLFLLLFSHGLYKDPLAATRNALAHLAKIQGELTGPNRLTVAFSDGHRIYGFRWSSDGRSPSLYFGRFPRTGGALLASEPIGGDSRDWHPVPEATFFTIDRRAGFTSIPL